ncbi:hypothetical protein BJ875DRAFT_34054 [Amylocarpus encephaloides]|uniref:Uncharacterized protein n=1 Tax=Amylocarpus encephaloides TaxID=45428 RepID=A0A9P8C552_9HELO|nr:hypothetical protein BJ875DRAFT_34054 [Amylocarpus encephaloides]
MQSFLCHFTRTASHRTWESHQEIFVFFILFFSTMGSGPLLLYYGPEEPLTRGSNELRSMPLCILHGLQPSLIRSTFGDDRSRQQMPLTVISGGCRLCLSLNLAAKLPDPREAILGLEGKYHLSMNASHTGRIELSQSDSTRMLPASVPCD